MKVVVIGGVAGGASVAARARRIDETAEVIMFERGENVSFSNCCLPFALSGIVDNSDKLVLMNPDEFWNKYRIKAVVNHEVTEILPEKKEICLPEKLLQRVMISLHLLREQMLFYLLP